MAQSLDTSQVGRPTIDVDSEDVHFLLSKGFSKTEVAKILGVSRQTLYNKSHSWAQTDFCKYTPISNTDLDLKVQDIKSIHPNDGEVMLTGHLRSQGIRVPRAKLRASIQCVDPDGTAERRSKAVKRRIYQVNAANDVWHIDGHHKLIRWRMVVHGGIDGYSRLIPFLRYHTHNTSTSVLSAFLNGVSKYGLLKKVRTDHGGENIDVWRHMIHEYSSEQCVITGSSTHNERIERLWRDVHRSVVANFATVFRELEAENHLDPLNEVDMYCLHSTYIPEVNASLDSFVAAWNNHPISTEQNRTPEQLFFTSMSGNDCDTEDSEDSDADSSSLPSAEPVPVPRCIFKPCTQLLHSIDNELQRCVSQAKPRYLARIDACGRHLMNNCINCNAE